MMYIMVVGVVRGHELQRIKWNAISTVIVDSLECGQREENHGLACGHKGACLGNDRTDRVKKESFNRVIV